MRFREDRNRDDARDLPVEADGRLPRRAEVVGHVTPPDQDDHDRLRTAVLLQGLDGVVAHDGVPRALSLEHRVPLGLGQLRVYRVVLVEVRVEEFPVLGAVEVDLSGHVPGFLFGQPVEALRRDGRHDFLRYVEGDDRDLAFACEKENVAVVVPVVAPVRVPVGRFVEALFGEVAGAPVVEVALLGVRVHLEPEEDLAAGADQLLEDPELDLVVSGGRVILSHEQERGPLEPLDQGLRRDHLGRARVRDPVEDERSVPVLPGRVADGHVEHRVVGGRGARWEEEGDQESESGRGQLHGGNITPLQRTCPQKR